MGRLACTSFTSGLNKAAPHSSGSLEYASLILMLPLPAVTGEAAWFVDGQGCCREQRQHRCAQSDDQLDTRTGRIAQSEVRLGSHLRHMPDRLRVNHENGCREDRNQELDKH